METIRMRLGVNVKKFRRLLGWSQAALAEKVDITPTFMMHIERGTRGTSLETVELLATALGVDIPDLFQKTTNGAEIRSNPEFLLKNLESTLINKMNIAIKESIDEAWRA